MIGPIAPTRPIRIVQVNQPGLAHRSAAEAGTKGIDGNLSITAAVLSLAEGQLLRAARGGQQSLNPDTYEPDPNPL